MLQTLDNKYEYLLEATGTTLKGPGLNSVIFQRVLPTMPHFLFCLTLIYYFFFFRWRYSPLWALACRTIPLHFSLSITNSLHSPFPSIIIKSIQLIPLLDFRNNKFFLLCGVVSPMPNPQPGGPGYPFLLDLSGSSQDHVTTQAPPLHQSRDTFRGLDLLQYL